ncbi:MAG: hypothetical protein LBG71_04435 [Clostridiales Family XIII bacterium]|nr:hypothetical protein [Clostridiales Family XIII bacterium]
MEGRIRDKALAALFMAALAGFCLWGLLAPDKAESATENRRLAQAPALSARALFSGRFMEDFESYASEQFPLRDAWTGLADVAGFAAGKGDNGRAYYGKEGRLFQMDSFDFRQLDRNIGHINAFFGEMSEKYPKVRLAALAAPSAWNVEGALLPDFAPVPDERAALERMRDGLAGGVVFIDPSESLAGAAAEGEEAYFRTDHHWTADGAYLAYRDWSEAMGRRAREKESFERAVASESFLGSTDSKARLPWTRPDRVAAYFDEAQTGAEVTVESGAPGKPGAPLGDGLRQEGRVYGLYDYGRLSGKDKYAFFLGGNYPVARVRTGAANGRTLLVLKDSFANCFAPFLCGDFEEVILVDLRYYNGGLERFFEEDGVDEALALYGAERLVNERNFYRMRMGAG